MNVWEAARLAFRGTADAAVRVESVENVLRVPSSTVRTEDGQRVVGIPGADGGEPVTLPYTPGAVGDEYTEVLLPQGQVSSIQGGPPEQE